MLDKVCFAALIVVFLFLNAKMFNYSFLTILRWILPVFLFLIAAKERSWKVPLPPALIFVFLIAVIPSLFVSIERSTSASKAISFILVTYCLYVFFSARDCRAELETYLQIALAGIILFQALNIVFCLVGMGYAGNDRYNGFTTNANTLGIYSNLAIWASYYSYQEKSGSIKWFSLFMLIASIVLTLLSGSRSSFAILLINIALLIILSVKSNYGKIILVIIIALVMYMMFSGYLSFLNITALNRLLEEDGTTRGDIWEAGIEVWKDHDLFGCGYRVSSLLNLNYGTEGMDFHNSYLSLLAETGLWGVTCMALGVLPVIVKNVIYLLKNIRSQSSLGFITAFAMSVNLLINAWGESFLFSVGSTEAFLFWLLLIWMNVFRRQNTNRVIDTR